MLVIISSPYTDYVNATVGPDTVVPFIGKTLNELLSDETVSRIVFDAAQYVLNTRINVNQPSNILMDALNYSVFFYGRFKQRQLEVLQTLGDFLTPVSRLIDVSIWYLLSMVKAIVNDCRTQLNQYDYGSSAYQISAINNGILIKCR